MQWILILLCLFQQPEALAQLEKVTAPRSVKEIKAAQKEINQTRSEINQLKTQIEASCNVTEDGLSEKCSELRVQLSDKVLYIRMLRDTESMTELDGQVCKDDSSELKLNRKSAIKDCAQINETSLSSCQRKIKKCNDPNDNDDCPLGKISELESNNKKIAKEEKSIEKYETKIEDTKEKIEKAKAELINLTVVAQQAEIDKQININKIKAEAKKVGDDSLASVVQKQQELDQMQISIEKLEDSTADIRQDATYKLRDLALTCYDQAVKLYIEGQDKCLIKRKARIEKGLFRSIGFSGFFSDVSPGSCSSKFKDYWTDKYETQCKGNKTYIEAKKRINEARDKALKNVKDSVAQYKKAKSAAQKALSTYIEGLTTEHKNQIAQTQFKINEELNKVQEALQNKALKESELNSLILSLRELETMVDTERNNLLQLQENVLKTEETATKIGITSENIDKAIKAISSFQIYERTYTSFGEACCNETYNDNRSLCRAWFEPPQSGKIKVKSGAGIDSSN